MSICVNDGNVSCGGNFTVFFVCCEHQILIFEQIASISSVSRGRPEL